MAVVLSSNKSDVLINVIISNNTYCVMESVLQWFSIQNCHVRFDYRIKPMFGSSLTLVVCRRDHVLFTLFLFVCVQWYPTHIVLCVYFVFLRPASLDCPFLIAYRYSLMFNSLLVYTFGTNDHKFKRCLPLSQSNW